MDEEKYRIRPDDPKHEKLENDVVAFIESLGGKCYAAPYHETLPKDAIEALQLNFTLTSLYLRGRADKIAIIGNHVFLITPGLTW